MALLSVALCQFAVSAQPLSWRFESDQTGWQPRAKTIAVTRVIGQGATAASKGCLHISGSIDTGWNYVTSDHRPMTAGKLYRLSAWVKVVRVGSGTPMPCLKCEFVAKTPGKDLGRVNTTTYDATKMGQWQQLTAEFQAPPETVACWLALEKNTSDPTEIDASIDDVKVAQIDRLSVFDQYRLDPLPAPLARLRGVHPRLFVDAARVKELRAQITTTHAALWQEIREQADAAVKRGAPKYVERDRYSGDEQLYQREVGNTMALLAMAYLITGEQRYLDAAREWALASCSYPTWGLGHIDGMDLAAGHQLFGLGIVYDWCYAGLGDAARKTIRDTIVKRGTAMFEAAATGKAWWRRAYLQNHLWVNACGLSTAGLAVFDEVPDANLWIGLGLDKFKRTMASLGDDGASQEGVGYWEYGAEYMLKFIWLARQTLGVDLFDHAWWHKTALYPLYLSLPRNAWTRRDSIVNIADCPRSHWYGPDYQLRCLARENHDGHAQWLAQAIDDANIDAPAARWLNLVWYDPTVHPEPPADLPTMHHFTDLDIVSARSNWSGDESLVVFKCGPFIGHTAIKEFSYDPGGGHVHPDANHFVLFGDGEWLISDDGYSSKWTGQHNTLLIDGKGQMGEGHEWFNGSVPLAVKADPRIVQAVSTPQLDQMTGDATEAYPRDSGLQRYVRHLLYLKPNVLIVIDDIQVDHSRPLELRFHPEQQTAVQDANGFLCKGKTATLRVTPLTTDGVNVTAEDVAGQDRHGGSSLHLFTIRLQTDQAHWRDAVALSWAKAGETPPTIVLKTGATNWTFTSASQQVDFKWETGKATLRAG